MFVNNNNIQTNMQGIPYITTTSISVSETAVNFALGFRNISPVGLFAVRISSAIPDGTTQTLPITLTLNGITRPLTFFGGNAVTAASVSGTGVILAYNDKYNGILQIIQTAPATTATTGGGA
jgi:hypothetical protein